MPLEAQQNIAQAMTIHTAEIMRGSGEACAKAASGLAKGDFPVIYAGCEWIALMQAASRATAQDADTDPTDDVAWPAPPDGLAALVARF